MNNSPEGAQGSANSKTPLTQTGVPFILEAIPAEAYQEFSHIFIIRDGGALGHSPKMSEATIGYTRYRKQDAEYIASAVNEYPDLSRQLAQSEERVAKLEGAVRDLDSKCLGLTKENDVLRGILVMLKRELDDHTTDPTKFELPKAAWEEAMNRVNQ